LPVHYYTATLQLRGSWEPRSQSHYCEDYVVLKCAIVFVQNKSDVQLSHQSLYAISVLALLNIIEAVV